MGKTTSSSSTSNQVKPLSDEIKTSIKNKIPKLQKVFYIAQSLLRDDSNNLHMEQFYHPGRGQTALFLTQEHENKEVNLLMEVLEFAETRRSWLVDSDVCSDGKIYITTPVDSTFLALHYIRKHCIKRALSLDCIQDDNSDRVTRLLTTFVKREQLKCIADAKTVDNVEIYYKYNAEKTLAWLALKARHLADVLRSENVHCGNSALSQNYSRSEIAREENIDNMDYLRMACSIVGDYVDIELYEELVQYLEIPAEWLSVSNKRKSLQNLKASENKKLKFGEDDTGVTAKLSMSNLLDKSLDDAGELNRSTDESSKATPLKERTLTTKEKALAKSAKGTKSIASFFKK